MHAKKGKKTGTANLKTNLLKLLSCKVNSFINSFSVEQNIRSRAKSMQIRITLFMHLKAAGPAITKSRRSFGVSLESIIV